MAYSTPTLVRERILLITTSPTTAVLNDFISHADAKINAVALTTFTTAEYQDSIVEQVSTDLAAYYALASDVTIFSSNSQAALTANMLYEAAMDGLEKLKDQRVVKFLQK